MCLFILTVYLFLTLQTILGIHIYHLVTEDKPQMQFKNFKGDLNMWPSQLGF